MRTLCFPYGRCYHKPTDAQRKTVSDLITTESEVCRWRVVAWASPRTCCVILDALSPSIAYVRAHSRIRTYKHTYFKTDPLP